MLIFGSVLRISLSHQGTKVDIATYLSKPEQVHLRNYLNVVSDQSFGTWVTDYLGAKYRVTGVDDGEYGSSM